MSATDELRRLLDERGVEWIDTGDGSTLIPSQEATNIAWDVNRWPSGKDMGDCLWVQNRHPLAPEQAIAATLGGQPAKLTAEQVLSMVGKHQPDYCSDTHVCFDWQAIADELNGELGSDREAELEALAKDMYENAVDFNFKGWIPYYRDRFAALGIEVER